MKKLEAKISWHYPFKYCQEGPQYLFDIPQNAP